MKSRRRYVKTAGVWASSCLLLLLVCTCVRQASHPTETKIIEQYQLGKRLYSQQRFEQALEVLLENQRIAPRFAANAFLIGKIYFFTDDLSKAQHTWEKNLVANPNHIDTRKWLARLYLYQESPDKAEAILAEALTMSSEDAELLILMGRANRQQEDLSAAIECYIKAQAFTERLAEASIELAEIYYGFGLRERAAGELQKALDLLGEQSSISHSVSTTLRHLREAEPWKETR